ncbi:class I SAM-dependent methyltransferase [Tunicatimonas pelagia]|uniref:class I SAM-dependent methyltransferase n=1 Tax=Tunicatimonas pelagia TaxID=931531 RepID=UPI0026661220|nr:class I SAM-dependent methyltransferase [Tunicatimonas pelagia]WKN41210.1 methyltransferase domain-containing protein [Tunicatimonas pelagia]
MDTGTIWTEENSKDFIQYGNDFVPYRDEQQRIIGELINPLPSSANVVDLGCGAGLLSYHLLKEYPQTTVYGYDGSPTMLEQATQQSGSHRNRFRTQQFDLAATDWRTFSFPVHAVVSSLLIHHLDDAGKQQLFQDLYQALAPGGSLFIADIIRPATPVGFEIAARQWDTYVQQQQHPDAYQTFTQDHWNYFAYPDEDPIDQPSTLPDQLNWLREAGFDAVDAYWMFAGHAIFGGKKE